MDERIKKLFKKYQEGTATDREREIIEEWFLLQEHFQQDLSKKDKIRVFMDLDTRIRYFFKEEIHLLGKNHPRKFSIKYLIPYAAILLIGLSACFFFLNRNYQKNPSKIHFKKITTAYGVRKQIILQDSSIVYLNVGSELIIPDNFGKQERKVQLSGEAYFEIKKNPLKKFIISTAHLNTTVLGTSFNVKSYQEDVNEQITVSEGKVQISSIPRTISEKTVTAQLTQNEQLLFTNKSKPTFKVMQVNASRSGSWRYDQIEFENASIQEISLILERWYGIPVRLKDPTKNCRKYTLSFNNEPLNRVLNVLKELSGINYTINKNKITIIDSKSCKINSK
ncbi:FecR family protein [bacterium A37T11]|nr:FecR family protein [bacterium A37T11]